MPRQISEEQRTRRPRPRRARGLTMLELLIVVVILGILAGLVFPHYLRVSESAKAAAMLSDLQMIRQQLKAYEVDHGGEFPLLSEMWGNLIVATDGNGNPGTEFGPYLKAIPRNPFTEASACAADNGADWEYDETTGAIRAVVPADLIADLALEPQDVVAAP